MAAVLTALLSINALRMWWFTIGSDQQLHVPLWIYLRKLLLLPAALRHARAATPAARRSGRGSSISR